jgi:hypothetical protein
MVRVLNVAAINDRGGGRGSQCWARRGVAHPLLQCDGTLAAACHSGQDTASLRPGAHACDGMCMLSVLAWWAVYVCRYALVHVEHVGLDNCCVLKAFARQHGRGAP